MTLPVPIVVDGPSEAPVDLVVAKARLDIGDALDDPDLQAYINAAVEQGESYTESTFIDQTLKISLDYFPDEIELPRAPVSSIVSVQYIDADGNPQTVNASDYKLSNTRPKRPWLLTAAGFSWPDTYDTTDAVTIQYKAGYANAAACPEDIKQAILIAVGHWNGFRKAVENGGLISMPRQFFALLERHRIYRF